MLKKIITYIISFFLSLCILLLTSLLIFSNTILSKNYMISMLEQNNYYERTYEDIKDGFKNYIMQSGLEESILDDLCSKEEVKNDINMVIDCLYENRGFQIDTQTMKNKLDNRINKVLKQNNRIPEAEEREAIQIFEDTIIDTYENGIVYSKSVIEKAGDLFEKGQKIMREITMMCGAVVAVLFIIIIVVNCNIKKILKFGGIAVLTSGILCSLIKLFVGNIMYHILILNVTFSETIKMIFESIINHFWGVGMIYIIIGLLSIIIGNWKKQQNKEIKSEQ